MLSKYTPHASAAPNSLDLTQCPYFWPYCTQPLYYGALPMMLNVTILNGMGVSGEIVGEPVWKPANNGEMLELSFTYPDLLWPWTGIVLVPFKIILQGWLGIHLKVHPDAAQWKGDAEGVIVFTVVSPPGPGEIEFRKSTIELPLKARIIPTPPRR